MLLPLLLLLLILILLPLMLLMSTFTLELALLGLVLPTLLFSLRTGELNGKGVPEIPAVAEAENLEADDGPLFKKLLPLLAVLPAPAKDKSCLAKRAFSLERCDVAEVTAPPPVTGDPNMGVPVPEAFFGDALLEAALRAANKDVLLLMGLMAERLGDRRGAEGDPFGAPDKTLVGRDFSGVLNGIVRPCSLLLNGRDLDLVYVFF